MGRKKATWSGGEDTVHYSFLISQELDRRLQALLAQGKSPNMSALIRHILDAATGEEGKGPRGEVGLPLWVEVSAQLRSALEHAAAEAGTTVEAVVQAVLLKSLPAYVEDMRRSREALDRMMKGGGGAGEDSTKRREKKSP